MTTVLDKIAEIRSKASEGVELSIEERLFLLEVGHESIVKQLIQLKEKLHDTSSKKSEKGVQDGAGENVVASVVDPAQRSLFNS